MVRTEGIKRENGTQRTRTARSRLGWRITSIIYDDVEVGRKIATAKRDDPAKRK